MANTNNLASYNQVSVSNWLLGSASGVALGVAANAIVTIPILSGGVTGNVAGGNYIVRRITARNPSGAVTTANVVIASPSLGPIAQQGMANLTATGKFVDFIFNSVAAGNVATASPAINQGLPDNFLYVNIQAAAAANNTVDIAVFGEVLFG